MSFEASCPACGNTLSFRFETSLLAVCPQCHVAVARKGADLEAYGRTADPLPTPTRLALDLAGRLPDGRGFTIAGRLQLDWGAGAWDEWHLAIDDGTFAWLAETQGKLYLMRPAQLPWVPAFSRLGVGTRLALGKIGAFTVVERRDARFMTAAGQLPFRAAPGSVMRYADLSGAGGYLATIDYADGEEADALYVGRETTLEELGIALADLPVASPRRAAGEKLSCPQCAGPLELRAPDQAQRVACPFCGTLLDATGKLEILQTLDGKVPKPAIPLGSRGTLGGVEWTVIGFMVRSTRVEGVRYPWREYLIHEPAAGFAWLVESNGHWSFVQTVPAGDVDEGPVPVHDGLRYKHFQSCKAKVEDVLGEFYWAVARGDEVKVDDYVSPPYALSREKDGHEVTWSRGQYLDADELWSALHLETEPPPATGVAANQLWPRKQELERTWLWALAFVVVMGLTFLALRLTGGKVVLRQKLSVPARAASGSEESQAFTDRFQVARRGNLEIRVDAPVSNTWLYLDGALIDEAAGIFVPFDVEVSYYSGSDWREGSTRAHRYIGSVTPGTYELRFAPQWEAGKSPPPYELTVTSRKPRFTHLLLATLLVLAWPLALSWAGLRFEHQRWSESDHPMFESSED